MSEKQTPVKELTLQEAQDEIKPLRAKLTKWGKEYYEQDNPTVEDHVYDRAYQRLVQLEEQFPQLVSADSPTQRVGGATESQLTKVRHEIPMLSMGMSFRLKN